MKKIDLINSNFISIVNEVSFVGDSIVFFWPLVNKITDYFIDKEIQIFHPHKNLFKSVHFKIKNNSLESFFDNKNKVQESITLAFIKSDGILKNHLKSNGFKAIVKGMVGMDFSTLNMQEIDFLQNEYDSIVLDAYEIKYCYKNREIHKKSGYPVLFRDFYNIYDYAKICNETFFGFENMCNAVEQNINLNNVCINVKKSDFLLPPLPIGDNDFILINLICGTFKKDVAESYFSLIKWIQKIVYDCEKENLNIYLLSDSKFPNLKSDLEVLSDNLFFLKEESLPFWTQLIKYAEIVYSIDTGFLHISHVLNKNTYGFGGDVDFWFFKDRIIDFKESL